MLNEEKRIFEVEIDEQNALNLLEEGKELMNRLLAQAERLKKDNELLMAGCLRLKEENEDLMHRLDTCSEKMLELQVRSLQAETELLSLKSRIRHLFSLKDDSELSRFLNREEENAGNLFQA